MLINILFAVKLQMATQRKGSMAIPHDELSDLHIELAVRDCTLE